MILTYLFLLWERASKGTVLLTDRLSIIAGPFATSIIWMVRKDMGDTLPELIGIGVAASVVFVVVLRLLASPYLLWKDQNEMLATLNVELAKPKQIERQWLAEHVAKTRASLANELSRMVNIAQKGNVWSNDGDQSTQKKYRESIITLRDNAYEKADELSYVPYLRELSHKVIEHCTDLITIELEKEKPYKDKINALNEDYKKLLKLLLHR